MAAFPPITSLLDFVPRDVLAKRAKPERALPALPIPPPRDPPRAAPVEADPPPRSPAVAPAKRRYFTDIFGPFGKS